MSNPTNTPDAQAIRSLRLQLVTAQQHLKDGLNTVSKALQTLENWEDGSLALTNSATPSERAVAIHRARGGRGKPLKIEIDPELESSIRERINKLTFAQIAAEVEAAFPPERHTSISGISRWWAKVNPAGSR